MDIFPPHWLTKETAHFVFYYLKHPKLKKVELEEKFRPLIEKREAAYDIISKYLSVQLKNKINFYFFPSREAGAELLGGLAPNQALPGIYTIFSRMEQTPGHELAHVLSFYMGKRFTNSYAFLSEGLACHLDQTGWDYHRSAKKLLGEKKLVPFKKIADSIDFKKADSEITYPQCGSFVKFLIDTYGLEKFKKLWVVRKNIQNEFQKIYRGSLGVVEAKWEKSLANYEG